MLYEGDIQRSVGTFNLLSLFLKMNVKVVQSLPVLYDPIDCSPPGFAVHRILQARILEWVAIPFSRGSSWRRDWTRVSHVAGRFFNVWATREAHTRVVELKSLSRVQLFVTPWTVAHQAPLSRGFSRQEYWSGLPFPSPGDLPNPRIEPRSPALEADALSSHPPGKPLIFTRPIPKYMA